MLRLENVSRLPTGLLLVEDPSRTRSAPGRGSCWTGWSRGGVRELSYPVRSDLRGRFTIGPLQVRIADPFGLVELARSFPSTTTLVVTPQVMPLPPARLTGELVGRRRRPAPGSAAAGEDDVVARAYRDGDELRRVHWRSTARYGELMVRREEQRWRNRATVLLDTRRDAHRGPGRVPSFEFAVSAAASIGVHLAREGMDGAAGHRPGPGHRHRGRSEAVAAGRPVRGGPLARSLEPALAALRPAAARADRGRLRTR